MKNGVQEKYCSVMKPCHEGIEGWVDAAHTSEWNK